MDEELTLLQLDKRRKGRSTDEILKHTIDPNLTPLERCLWILSKGDQVQKLSLLNSLPEIIEEDPKLEEKILAKVSMLLHGASAEFQIKCAQLYRDLLLNENVSPDVFLQGALGGILNKDSAIVGAWSEALKEAIPKLTFKTVTTRVFPIIFKKLKPSEPKMQILNTIPFLGAISSHPKIQQKTIETDLLPFIRSLSFSPHFEIRVAACVEYPKFAKGLGAERFKAYLLNDFVKICNDPHMNVRSAAGSVWVELFSFLGDDVLRSHGVIIAKEICTQTYEHNDKMAYVISKDIGHICYQIQSFIDATDGTFFLNCFAFLSQLGLDDDNHMNIKQNEKVDINVSATVKDPYQDILCRQNCAYNLPAMTQFVKKVCPGSFGKFYTIFHSLLSDPCYLVRQNVAKCVHVVGRILGMDIRIIKDDIILLLINDSEEVLNGIVPHIREIFMLLQEHKVLQLHTVDATVIQYGKALFTCESHLHCLHNWRLQETLYREFQCLPMVFPSEYIYSNFVPVLMETLMKGRFKPVREQVGVTLLIILKCNDKPQQQATIRNRILNEIRYSTNCYTRMLFIKMCMQSVEILSKEYFKEHFFESLISLADDPVPNLRMALLGTIPMMCTLLNSKDRHLLSKMESTIANRMVEETDNDCQERLKDLTISYESPSPPMVNFIYTFLQANNPLKSGIRHFSSVTVMIGVCYSLHNY